MNPVVRFLLLLVAALAVGGYAVHEYVQRTTEAEARLDLLRIEREFDERAPAAREIATAEDYTDEVRGLFKWYFSTLRDHDNRYPDFKDHEAGWRDIQRKQKVGSIKGPEFAALSQNRDAVNEVYQQLQHGTYDPILSGASNGQHFDIWRADRQTHDGKPMLRLDFVWWGPQRRIDIDKTDQSVTRRTIVNATVQSVSFSLLDDKGKVYGEMNGGEPNEKIPDPDRYVDLFPSNAVLGTYWIDLFPHEAQKLNLELTASTRTVQGHDINAKFSWSVPVKEDWKLAEGQKWEGAVEEEREEEAPSAPQANAKHSGGHAKGRRGE